MSFHYKGKHRQNSCFIPLIFRSLLNIPDGDLAIKVCGRAQYVAVLHRAEGLDAVCVGLQLFCHSAALWVHHHHQTFHLTVTLTCDTAPAIAAHPYLKRREDIEASQRSQMDSLSSYPQAYLVFNLNHTGDS